MKYILFIMAISISLIANGQDCEEYDFSTYPSTANNTQDPHHLNTDFDWTAQNFDFYNLGSWYQGALPFFQTSGNPYMTHFHESQDKEPEDGWELVHYDFGTQIKLDNQNNPIVNPATEAYELETVPVAEATNPIFVLYNRYTGIMRIFARIEQQYAGYSMARIMLYFENGNSLKKTSLINDYNTLLALDQFSENPVYNTPTAFINTQGKWFYTDFYMNYDPCTCDMDAKLKLDVWLIEEAEISLKGQTNGDIVSVQNKATINDKAENAFTIGGQAIVNANAGFQKAWKAFKTADDFQAKQFKEINDYIPSNAKKDEYKAGVTLFQEALIENEFMREGLKIVPYASTALAFVDLFVSGGKKDSSTDPIKLHPMTIQSTSEYSGTIASNQLYNTQDFWLPGSDNLNKPVRQRPWYNKTMGIFNLMTTPSIKFDYIYSTVENYEERVVEESWEYFVEFSNDLDYVINYEAGFDDTYFPDIQGQLVFEFDTLIGGGILTNDDNMIQDVIGSQIISRIVPVSCLDDALNLSFSVSHSIPNLRNVTLTGIKLKLFVNLKRTDADEFTQNVLFVGTYPLEIILDNELNSISPYANIQDVVNLENTVVTTDIRAWETINIGENVIIQPQNGNLLNITAGKEVNISSNANTTQIFQKTRIKVESLFANTCEGTNPPQTEGEIRSFCESEAYQTEARGFLKNADIEKAEKEDLVENLTISPNPTTTFVNIESHQNYRLSVFNLLGQQVGQVNGTLGTHNYNMMNLESGVYFFHFDFEDGTKETLKVIKN